MEVIGGERNLGIGTGRGTVNIDCFCTYSSTQCGDHSDFFRLCFLCPDMLSLMICHLISFESVYLD